jgi:hypothetical protein
MKDINIVRVVQKFRTTISILCDWTRCPIWPLVPPTYQKKFSVDFESSSPRFAREATQTAIPLSAASTAGSVLPVSYRMAGFTSEKGTGMPVGDCNGSAVPSAWSCRTGHRNCRRMTLAGHCWPWPLRSRWPPCAGSLPYLAYQGLRPETVSNPISRFMPILRTELVGVQIAPMLRRIVRLQLRPRRCEASGLAADCAHCSGPAPADQPTFSAYPAVVQDEIEAFGRWMSGVGGLGPFSPRRDRKPLRPASAS